MWRGCEDQYEDLKTVTSFVYIFFLSKSKLITCCFWYVGSIPTQGMKLKLLVLEKNSNVPQNTHILRFVISTSSL